MRKDSKIDQYYLGTAQVQVQNLIYESNSIEPDNCTGCCISDVEHNLPVLITRSQYNKVLLSSNISEQVLHNTGSAPRLRLPNDLILPCLHGKFRLETAKAHLLNSQETWWRVDFFIAGR